MLNDVLASKAEKLFVVNSLFYFYKYLPIVKEAPMPPNHFEIFILRSS